MKRLPPSQDPVSDLATQAIMNRDFRQKPPSLAATLLIILLLILFGGLLRVAPPAE